MTAAIWPVALAAIALFALEPFAAKVLLPRLGGTPMVWNTCMFVFQALLVAGAAVASRCASPARVGRYRWLAVTALAVWPLGVRLLWLPPSASVPPVVWMAGVLLAGIGPMFVLLAATSPLVQVWAAGGRAHRLYAVSNIASALGLLLYVAVIEPFTGLRAQSWLLWALALVVCAGTWRVVGRTLPSTVAEQPAGPPASEPEAPALDVARPERPGVWLTAAAAASFCLFSVNTFLATDVASFPLLFAIPLVTFLAAFAAGFTRRVERAPVVTDLAAALTAAAALYYLFNVATLSTSAKDVPWPVISLGGVVTLLAARLADARPSRPALPRFYLMIGLGGIVAGAVSVLVVPSGWTRLAAPWAGSDSWLANAAVPEFPVSLALGLLVGARGWAGRVAGTVAAVWVLTATTPTYGLGTAFQARNFYGTVRVQVDPSSGTHRLQNGTTLHGFEVIDGPGATLPTSYYHRASPIGQVMGALGPRRVLALGLGAGTLAAYARPGDRYVFLEINPLVESVATRSGYFSFVPRARARGAVVDVDIGDGRQLAAALPAAGWDLIVLDAFASDSIPVHLLTVEAFAEYAAKASPGGVIAVHVSNRFFDLGPVVAAMAERIGWQWVIQSRRDSESDETPSTWVMLSRDGRAATAAGLTGEAWTRPAVPAGVDPWTDDWANLLSRLKIVTAVTGRSFAD